MLVLERKDGQKVILETADGLVEVSVHGPHQGRVKLGISAPITVVVLREEVAARRKT